MTPDPCCALCKHSTGVCLSRYACEHHRIADAQDEASHRATRQYRDPTGDQAVRNAMNKRGRR